MTDADMIEAMARAIGPSFIGNRMPDMSGDPLRKATPYERRRIDEAVTAALAVVQPELDRLEAELASRPTPDGGGWQDERKEICAELGCIDDPGVPLRFVKGLRKDLRKAYARQDELIRSWDKATPTERQELDRLRRGWGPSTPTTHQKRWQDVKDCMTQIERVYDLCSPEDEDESPQQTLEKVSAALFEAIGFCSQRIQEICGHPGDKVDYSFTEGLTAMREMLASFVENGGDTPCKTLAQSMRLNWNPSWGDDPNRLPSPPKGELT